MKFGGRLSVSAFRGKRLQEMQNRMMFVRVRGVLICLETVRILERIAIGIGCLPFSLADEGGYQPYYTLVFSLF